MNKAWLVDMKTGKTVEVTEQCLESSEYYWTEGNMSCDCNRSRMFDIENFPCSEKEFKGERFQLITTVDFPWKEYEE